MDMARSCHCRGLLRLKLIHWINLFETSLEPATKGYEDGLAACLRLMTKPLLSGSAKVRASTHPT